LYSDGGSSLPHPPLNGRYHNAATSWLSQKAIEKYDSMVQEQVNAAILAI
jgi:hypothetical protein